MTEPTDDDAREGSRLLADLRTDPQNRRQHPERNLDMVRAALEQVGAARSIVIDEDDIVLAGNGVRAAALAAGITSVRIIESAGDELIAVRRRGLTPEQKRALAMFDNRTGELATWDVQQLAADLQTGMDLQPFFFPEELKALGIESPNFDAVAAGTQGHLDQKRMITCPGCGAVFPLTP